MLSPAPDLPAGQRNAQSLRLHRRSRPLPPCQSSRGHPVDRPTPDTAPSYPIRRATVSPSFHRVPCKPTPLPQTPAQTHRRNKSVSSPPRDYIPSRSVSRGGALLPLCLLYATPRLQRGPPRCQVIACP